MDAIFFKLFLGHLLGDYGLQPKKMAYLKSDSGWKGFWVCTLHSLIYTLCIALFVWRFDLMFLSLIFLTHWPIDRYSLASKWLDLIKGRTFMEAYGSKDPFREFDVGFTCIVYERVDMMFHFILMYLIILIF
ncbi:hypothetical protein A2331_03160 [Candidatus Falkowbacteria bacterium RIFOXYB2_FULL_34_18]|uniref:DUF3307 domain-containing protein n=1 Tax=Candidatus Falkowbacteria bacterium RIFOXYD2_FULL_34_120 TaxID=1798007 RepID=A0A1F5TN66_9BACT|nr:MAG: hypothetical protein A2500_00130 [Candidatus Falkowbacteria bacterium RIFOXYC12_FULL_34_55]OGF28631.1 MAG: hypothetical protein A2331_03160 [Candidatus Falkowbacteria bacterium RIFOXYB2_FULL_34_18]OGF38193.1 MAG: hypothetical protein A2466_00055 [Candidatus Falkowbacteria bacterium RIFOXYC2_FULL_34_220]OGF38303.1 MAG: hypothetical protein A2515_00800 [Candidatus Falkowbacteria bacterium RIFOXYD12_FULL_34_57]OGF40274.1 MAG: hypothetical protein A2531_04555 [Candidatus Falkowbacteria bact